MDTNKKITLEQSYYAEQCVKSLLQECMVRNGIEQSDAINSIEATELKQSAIKFIGFMQSFANKKVTKHGQPDNTYLVRILNDQELHDSYIAPYEHLEDVIAEAVAHLEKYNISDKYRIEITLE